MTWLMSAAGTFCLVVATLLASWGAWSAITVSPSEPQGGAQTPLTPRSGISKAEVPLLTERSKAYFDAIVERPLFATDRRPTDLAATPQKAARVAADPELIIVPPRVELMGTVVNETRRAALLAMNDEPPSWISQGSSLDDWTVTTVEDEAVELTIQNQTIRVELFGQ